MAGAAVTERCKKNKNLLEWLDSIILAVAVLSLVFTFAARAIRVDGHSMDPTLHDQQLLIINSLPYPVSYTHLFRRPLRLQRRTDGGFL